MARPAAIAAIPTFDAGEVRLVLGVANGRPVIKLERFDRCTPAKVLMPSREPVRLSASEIEPLIEALRASAYLLEATY